jgi:UPF0176 protein
MKILNIAGYKFLPLADLTALRADFLAQCEAFGLKGTILLSVEGVNLNLSGLAADISSFKAYLLQDARFSDITFRESFSQSQPFKYMRVKIKKEIITMHRPEVCPEVERAPSISPREFKKWLDEKRDITVLDTRNDYEIQFGAFQGATHFSLQDFGEFPEGAKKLAPVKPIVMYCTGGIRCEKAALHLLAAGFSEVYQLEGGILNYFSEVGGEHYEGECFVFDQRISVDHTLKETGTQQCQLCQGPVMAAAVSCSACN